MPDMIHTAAGGGVDAAAAEGVAAAFRETYQRLAPEHGYLPAEASAVPWPELPPTYRSLMRAVAAEIIDRFDAHVSLDELRCPGCGINTDRTDGLCACPKPLDEPQLILIPLCARRRCPATMCVCSVADQVAERQQEWSGPLAEALRAALADEAQHPRGVPSELAPGWMVDHRVELPPPAPVVHIAGIDVTIGDVLLRQRCAWCGVTLIDYDLSRVAVPVGQEGPPSTWPVGALVRVNGHAAWTVEHEDGAQLPADSCTRTDPAVTA